MDKRTFIKSSVLGGIGLLAMPTFLKSNSQIVSPEFTLPDLPYSYDALEPYIDAMTMEIHHGKHHAGYTRKFNNALKENNIGEKDIKAIFKQVSDYPDSIRNNGGGFYNHSLFWKIMSPNGGGSPKGDLLKAINKQFGDFSTFKAMFSKAAATRFGSGWAWLMVNEKGKLEVISSPNQDNPLMDISERRGTPILGLDVWEHAYYLKYQNKRGDYIDNFWNVINWDEVENQYNQV